MEAIAAAARVSKGTLYARYSTKEALLRVVVEAQVDIWSKSMQASDHMLPAGMKDQITYYARNFIRFMAAEDVRRFTQLMSGAPSASPEITRALYETGYRLAVDLLARAIADGTRNDPTPARNPQRVAEALQAMLWGWHNAEGMGRELPTSDAASFAEYAVELLFAGRANW